MPAEDHGCPNPPRRLNISKIRWEKEVPTDWWRNHPRDHPLPLTFTQAAGRFSGPDVAFGVLYLGANPATCFWESGLGRDLNTRMPDDMSICESDLKSRFQYSVKIEPKGSRIFNASDAGARRSIGAKTAACFSADHTMSRMWAKALHVAGADGILYESTRHSPGLCLALFQTSASKVSLSKTRKICSSYDDVNLLASLFAEGVSIIGR